MSFSIVSRKRNGFLRLLKRHVISSPNGSFLAIPALQSHDLPGDEGKRTKSIVICRDAVEQTVRENRLADAIASEGMGRLSDDATDVLKKALESHHGLPAATEIIGNYAAFDYEVVGSEDTQ